MSREIPLYCDTCMKYFSGPVSAQQHFESIDHQRKEADKRQAGRGENSLFCSYCNKQCNSLRQFQEHNASPMHLAVMERASRFNSPAPFPAPQATSRMDSEVSARRDLFMQPSVSEKANDLVGKLSYIFDGTRGYCNVCNLDLTSNAHARQHLNGEKHKKKERHFVQGTLGGTLSCALCQVSFSGPESAQQHLASDRHRRRRAEGAAGKLPTILPGTSAPLSSRPGAGLPAAQRPFPMFKFYCLDCNRPMNTKEAYDAHITGQAHRQKVAGKAAPPRDLGVRVKTEKAKQAMQAAREALICMEPRSYQVELFCKAMSSDSIIFLPTGTGKTVIAAMVVSRMLFLNPRRPVLFLVDKVLLVLQQGQVITRELRNQHFLRQNLSTDESKAENRELKIALLCGGLREVDATPLYRHDIIVTTAAYCENMLADGIIHWEDFSLVVLDEAHHCVGKHPYCNIMRNRHLELPPESRPKVLGLTASPAGKNTLEDTIAMLENLMTSLGDARLSIVEGREERRELDQFQSKTKITILTAEFTREERQLCDRLKEYIVRCYFKLAEVCKIKDGAPIFSPKSMSRPETERIQACAEEIDDDALKTFLTRLQSVKPDNKMEARALFDFLSQHVKFTIVTLMSVEGGAGVPFAIEEFRKLSSSGREKQFDTAEWYGLPAKTLMAFVNKLDQVQDLERDMEEKGMHQVSLFGQLRHVLFSEEYIQWGEREREERPMALVLVRERVMAIQLSEGLQQLEDVQTRGLRVCHVVGHGDKAGDGMRVQQQKRVLDGMRGRRYHIVVATSVAEEGVDIPECELVVTLNPPDSVTALVQMRGRARKRGSNFIVICEGEEEKQKLELLLQREKNMADAAKRCLSYNRSSST